MTKALKDKPIEEVDIEELWGIVEETRAGLTEERHRKLKAAIETLAYLTAEIRDKKATIRHLRKLLFGSKSEKTERVLPEDREEESAKESAGTEDVGARGADSNTKNDAKIKKKRKGHGRNGADKYVGADEIEVPHESLKPGDGCPETNCKGKVYRVADPAVLVRIVGQAPIHGKVYRLERLRCNLCLTVFTARAPEGVGKKKYDATAVSMMVILRYGSGLPLHRLKKLQESLGIPLPPSGTSLMELRRSSCLPTVN